VEQFLHLLNTLNGGLIFIIPFVDGAMQQGQQMHFCRLTFTDRYAPGSMRLKQIRAMLTKLLATHGDRCELMLYTARTTYRIDKEQDKPVVETSQFQLTSDGLRQLGTHAWRDVFVGDDSSHRIPTEYLKPHLFDSPPHLSYMLDEVKCALPGEHTVFIFSVANGRVCSLDIDTAGHPTTMHPDQLHRFVSNAKGDLLLLALAPPGTGTFDVGFRFNHDSCSRMDVTQCLDTFSSGVWK
jgi:hypothetical protein